MSQPPRSNRGHRERNGEHRERNGEHRERNGEHRNYRDSNDDGSSSRPPYYPRETDPPPKHVREREAPREEHHESKCSHICSRRGIMLICAVLTNSLVLICLVAAHMVSSGMSSGGGLGGFDMNSNFNLQGTELQKARELDMQYSLMRAPGLYGGIPFCLTLGVLSLLFVVAGNKPPHHMSRKLLYGALVFQAVGAVAYVVAVGLYLHFIIKVNATDVCQQRARIYGGRGYTWMNCDVGGADAAVALFGLITAILYGVGTVLTFQTIRRVRRYLEERKRREEEKQQARANAQRAPLRADTTSV
ncbi:MARVEL domain-containing protein 3 [Trematomus bernacchii]|uniref:MARVEL domain-containing protein 3 n=1 Tax=Trematomus bernacchii TaxID=40690 RepID=UPI00146CFCDB|nr:MARVEL domain-containing protein 3 [Trematomus bernacchii]XP_034003666.1 MARVEL domain-containing protein 3 [Trematomus bernacchii]